MSEQIIVSFPGGKKVDAVIKGMTVHTDQEIADGGEGTAPSPFDYFLASLATCSGIVALSYCQRNGLSTEGLSVTMEAEPEPTGFRYGRIVFHITLPNGFPEDRREDFLRRVEACAVKRHILNPPEFRTECHPFGE